MKRSEADITLSGRIVGIDSLRAVAALIVMLGHLKLFPYNMLDSSNGMLFALARVVSNCLFNGPAAVILFFIISGFCIHLSNTSGAIHFNVKEFYIRRAFRICIPALCAIVIYNVFDVFDFNDINKSVLWSVICEIIYYIMYPLLLVGGRRIGWGWLFVATYIFSNIVCIFNLDALRAAGNSYVALGWGTWIIGLPCWLLGCWLAENRQRFEIQRGHRIWVLRSVVVLLSFCICFARFHFPSVLFSECFTLNIFALPATAWIGMELSSRPLTAGSQWFEWMGKWSYSLYLIHPTSTALLTAIGVPEIESSEFYHLLRLCFALAISYIFYLVSELPAHQMARFVGRGFNVVDPACYWKYLRRS